MPLSLIITAVRVGIYGLGEIAKPIGNGIGSIVNGVDSIINDIQSVRLSLLTPAQRDAYFEEKRRQARLQAEREEAQRRREKAERRRKMLAWFKFYAFLAVTVGLVILLAKSKGCE